MALRIGDILLEKRIITQSQLDKALEEHKKTKEFLGQTLVRLGFITEDKLLRVLAEQQDLRFVEIRDPMINPEAVKSVPAKFAWHYKVMPIDLDNNILTVATSNPFDMWPMDDLETNLGFRVEMVIAVSVDILDAIKKYYGVGADTIERILDDEPRVEEKHETHDSEKVEDLANMADSASVVKLVSQILQQAINDRATDIHFEYYRDELMLRYRIDGVLYETQVSENIKYLYPAIISRIKVMANLDIVERRVPQDGRAKVRIDKKEYELRISIIPTLHGENVVIRVLPMTMLFSMHNLGMNEKELRILNTTLAKPHGIIFVTGPTGSGKTTTLYTCLNKLNTRERKIITIEDPVEYELKGVSQIQVNTKVSLTFARALRSILRHDPDVIMIGEVRDPETAEISIQTALTGHLVLSTLHTNDAAGGITRLMDMGVDPFLITSSVEIFMAQRLVRTICQECKERVALEKDKLTGYSGMPKIEAYYKGRGCKACNNSGYKGRAGIYEILVMNEAIKKMVLKNESSDQIGKKAIEMGMVTLRENGWQKVEEGITTPEEVLRVTQIEEAL